MQASCVYSPFAGFGKNVRFFGGRDKDYLVRSEKRTPYGAGPDGGKSQPPRRDRDRRPGALYTIVTLLLLIVVFPVGLFFLWARKLNWSIGAKLLTTVVTAVLFFCFVTFLINIDTQNATVKKVQDTIRTGLEWVNDHTGGSVDAVAGWGSDQIDNVKNGATELWNRVDQAAAQKLQDVYAHTDGMNDAARAIARLIVDAAETYAGYEGYVPEQKPVAPPEDIVKVTVVPTAEPTVEASPTPTPTPEPTPTPSPTPEPVILPSIKSAMYARVFFTSGGTFYHAVNNCSGMLNAVEHTLSEASEVGKKCCEVCGVSPLSMLDSEYYLWLDENKHVHTSDECELFFGGYKLIPFEEAYQGNYEFCATCGATDCRKYIEQNADQFIAPPEQLDQDTERLYEYEKTITVYYGANSRNYHANAECQHMTLDEYVHNLYDALHVDKKGRCKYCSPITEEDVVAEGKYLLDSPSATEQSPS